MRSQRILLVKPLKIAAREQARENNQNRQPEMGVSFSFSA
jgi:hypothetical protein